MDVFKCPGTNYISLRNGAFTGSCWHGLVIPTLGRTVRGLVALAPLSSRYFFPPETLPSNSSNNGPSIPGKTMVSVPSQICENGKRGIMFVENGFLVGLLIFRMFSPLVSSHGNGRCGYNVLNDSRTHF